MPSRSNHGFDPGSPRRPEDQEPAASTERGFDPGSPRRADQAPVVGADEQVITPGVLRDWPLPDPQGDKQARGTVLVVGGSRYTPGAVLLAGVAALRAGAGRLQLAVESSTAAALSIAVPEAKVVGLPERHGDVSADLLALARDADVIAIGPGLDDVDETARLMRRLLDTANKDAAVVLDAYALGALSNDA